MRPRRDLAQFVAAERAGIVQMDVEADAMPLGDAEDRVEMALDVVVDAGGIEPADEVGALAHRRVEQVGDAGDRHDAALREGDDLDIDEIPRRLAHPQQRVQPAKADLGVDVDVAAQRGRAERDDLVDQPPRARPRPAAPSSRRSSRSRAIRSATVAGPMRLKRQAEQRLVEMDMAVDEAGDEQRAAKIDRRRVVCDAAAARAIEAILPPSIPTSTTRRRAALRWSAASVSCDQLSRRAATT